jgi:hypothetical protein
VGSGGGIDGAALRLNPVVSCLSPSLALGSSKVGSTASKAAAVGSTASNAAVAPPSGLAHGLGKGSRTSLPMGSWI